MFKKYLFLASILILCTAYCAYTLQPDGTIEYPEGYRSWTHVKTAIAGAYMGSHSGFHHIYANDKAMVGYRTGKFPDGSILVFDVLESEVKENGDVLEGKRKLVDVMVRSHSGYDSTGGWGFEEFLNDSHEERVILNLSPQKCYSCHARQEKKDFVFSEFRN